MSFLYSIRKSLFGSHNSKVLKNEAKAKFYNPVLSYQTLVSKIKEKGYTQSTEAPIFIFSAGWRSGSTLLQRLITSENKLLIWGEPYDRCNLIQNMAKSMNAFDNSWPPEGYYIKNETNDLANQWIANLYPSLDKYLSAQTSVLLEMFSIPAQRMGAKNWGIKEVRFGLSEALFLKLLFPNAKFLYLERELHTAFSSYKSFNSEMPWFAEYPTKHVFTPYKFASHRRKMITEMKEAQKIVGGIHIKYEELISNQSVVSSIENYCDLTISNGVLNNKVGSGDQKSSINILDKVLLHMGNRYRTA
ncbi:sulfotransferase [Paraglaciecola sp. 2405UD69-4]|uniref:sulfotransferase n=1 Tax=Paraglaciecola sp. 2405UD69-4 TaxID=3391836 RepID=UPI0039C94A82